MKKIRILIADDHAMVRTGLASLLNARKELEVIGDAKDGSTAIQKALKLKPDIVIMDLLMPGMDGAEATEELLRQDPAAKVLILTTFGTADGIAHALKAGAKGAIMKNAEFSELAETIHTIANGGTSISAEIEQILAENPPVPELSARQLEILSSITRGLTNEDIAKQCDLSLQRVKEHLANLFTKLGAANRTEAVAIALRKHLLKM